MMNNINIGIVGAGIQGISNALFLQKKGFKVTIFDRDEPGSFAASYGKLHVYTFKNDNTVEIEPVISKTNILKEIENRISLFYTQKKKRR